MFYNPGFNILNVTKNIPFNELNTDWTVKKWGEKNNKAEYD